MTRFLRSSICLLLVGTFLYACSNNVEDKNDSLEASSFSVLPIKADGAPELYSEDSKANWSDIKDMNLMTFKACLLDITFNGPVVSSKFQIISPKQTITKTTDSSGCFSWTEAVSFNYLEDETYYDYPVSISGIGKYKGQKNLNLAINPWKEDSSVVKDMDHATTFNKASVQPSDDLFSEKSIAENYNLLIKQIRIKLKTSKKSNTEGMMDLIYEMEFVPYFQRLDLNGRPVFKSFTEGKFNGSFKLLEIDNDGRKWELTKTNNVTLNVNKDRIKQEVIFQIKESNYQDTNLSHEMAITLTPLNAPSSLGTEKGFVMMNGISHSDSSELNRTIDINEDFAGVKESRETVEETPELPIITDNEEPIIDEVEEEIPVETYADNVDLEVTHDNSFGYEINKVTLTPGVENSDTYNKSSKKSLRVNMTICVSDPLSQSGEKKIKNTKFKITTTAEENSDSEYEAAPRYSTTDNSGCFKSFTQVEYDKFSCEKYIPFRINIEAVGNGNYKGIKKERLVTVNPYNKIDFGYDVKLLDPPEVTCTYPKIHLNNIAYKLEGNDRSSYKINKFMHLTFNKNYKVTINPRLQLFNSSKEETLPAPITFGKFKTKITVYSPKHANVDYENPDLSEFHFLTASKKEVTVNPAGVIDTVFSMPFNITETTMLSYKNLVIIEIEGGEEHGNLRKAVYHVPFFGNSTGESLVAHSYNGEEPNEELASRIAKVVEKNEKLPNGELENGIYNGLSPLEIYRKELIRSGKNISETMKTVTGSLDAFNERGKVHPKMTKAFYTSLNTSDMRVLAETAGLIPNKIVNKFCRQFYPLPTMAKEMTWLQGYKDKEKGGERYKDCLVNPTKHFDRIPMQFVQTIYSSKDANKSIIGKAQYMDKATGNVFRGNAFFTAFGNRNSISTGERESTSQSTNLSWGVEGPSPFYLGFSRSTSFQNEVYQVKNEAEMYAAFGRQYTQRTLLDLTYNSIKLKFAARIRSCVLVNSKFGVPLQMHICREDDQLKRMTEEWFFIGDTNYSKHSIISDGNRVGDSNESQIIRGKSNYDRIWKQYESEDAVIAVKQLGRLDLGSAFESYYKNRNQTLPFENYVDNSFPGMIMPAIHERN